MNRKKKLIVGIFVGGCLLLFGVGLFLIGDSRQLFTKSFTVYADFAKITGNTGWREGAGCRHGRRDGDEYRSAFAA